MERAISAWCRSMPAEDDGKAGDGGSGDDDIDAISNSLMDAWSAALSTTQQQRGAGADIRHERAPPPEILMRHVVDPMKSAALRAWQAGQTVMECAELYVAFAAAATTTTHQRAARPPSSSPSMASFVRAFDAMRAWVSIVRSLARRDKGGCAQRQLRVYMIWTSLTRRRRSPADLRGAAQANGGGSFRCVFPDVIVYRREEWWKVFLHETLHSFGLDRGQRWTADAAAAAAGVFRAADRTSDSLLFEAYTECWARLWYIAWTVVVRTRRTTQTHHQQKKQKTTTTRAALFRALLRESQFFAAAQAERWTAPHSVDSLLLSASSPAAAAAGFQEQAPGLAYYAGTAALLCNLPALARMQASQDLSPKALVDLVSGALRSRAASRVRDQVRAHPPPLAAVGGDSMRMTHIDASPEGGSDDEEVVDDADANGGGQRRRRIRRVATAKRRYRRRCHQGGASTRRHRRVKLSALS